MNANCAIDFDYTAGQRPAAVFAPELEQQLLIQYLPLVKRIVRQLSLQASQVLDRDDMEQIGLMGLLESLRRYGTPDDNFGSFAKLRIRGAILDELRRQDWRPRQVRQQAHKIRDAIRHLARQLGRAPQDAEVMQFTGLSEKEYQAFLQADACEAIESLDELLLNGPEIFADNSSGLEEREITERLLAQALNELNERERLILILYYQQELSLKEIALVLDLTDARVCQLSKQAITKASRFLRERS
ncbi:FliA/WhiG family RNA polymerase sigma factor [Cellvibrio sp. PSBB023]|jgi:RNA polymerase sigma factor for flagellar operon FliA|uniref:FliA/WhiG family RNA polymerase sigma factor n=1 Tax=Cellvibrio sp. PSBB023 TaxID=1945512 RepID=UPI00098FA1EB|nr:FliA/WhiG family RNA polymerase sigma factor [Cellvibrio sp. PSBB023]AQT59859.1 RNA polymerase sigma factor FliA [Cellvibrio sp. PSBB023]